MKPLPHQCAEARADLVANIDSPYNERVLQFMIRRAANKRDHLFPPNYTGADAIHDILSISRLAELFTIAPQMLDLVDHASQSMPPQDLQREHVPSPHGFLWLPHPLRIIDIGGYSVPVQAITWHEVSLGGRPEYDEGEARRGLLLHMFVVNGGPEDGGLREKIGDDRQFRQMIGKMGMLGLVHTQTIAFGQKMWNPDATALDLSPEERADVARKMRNLQDGEAIDGSMDERGTFLVRTSEGHVIRVAPDRVVQFLSAFFSFYRSNLAGFDRDFAPKSNLKWFRRLGIDNSPITVLRLRRREQGKETGRGVALSYRHVRRGHWRRQPYGPRSNPNYEYIWIQPTLVGDDDLPLRMRDVVNYVVR